MTENESTFKAKSTIKSADIEHRQKINFNIGRYNAAVPTGKQQFADLNLAKERAKNIKWRALETLDQHLEEFEMHFTARGGKVIWAQNSQEALDEIFNICKEKNCKTVVKGKSMVTEEIHLNHFLKDNNIESIETDLGEYIQQLDGEPPYHIVTPAMHKNKEDVAKLFAEKLGTPSRLSPKELTLVAREKLREKYVQAEVGITGANFMISDIGAIAITENEGNGRLTTAWPKTHIVIAGIEKMIPSMTDLALMWPLLSTYGTGQKVTVYSNIITGPRQPGETDGPDEMYVILLDNNRSNILGNPVQRESLYCIRCGACLNVCPVYKNIGGHAYGTTYTGPIGSVITPNLSGLEEYKHLSFASSLCGACTEVCPVKINIHELLLVNRNESVEQGMTSFSEKMAWKVWKLTSLKRGLMNKGNGGLKTKVINTLFKDWNKHHVPLEFSKKTFNEMWKDRESLKS
ncbi:MAG TPA: LutB/LldF family L-lactate oxidation iron-sulfur protein [Hanamia sp.]|nr:LutB/LldF family L-lactate oxidation iron-sulfur protein [Hanamia sp.]